MPESTTSTLAPSEKRPTDYDEKPELDNEGAVVRRVQSDNGGADLKKASATQEDEDDPNRVVTDAGGVQYASGPKLWLISLALCLSVFLMALDNTIIATAIPVITNRFNSLDDVGWYGSSYLLTTASFQLLFGKFYTYFSIKWIYITAITIFEIGSLVCGVAPNSTTLIVGRAIAGLGSAGIFSGALIIIAYTVELSKRPIYTGLIGAMYGIASVAGPLLGGVFTDKATWRWCFYINLPLGAVTLIVIILFFKSPERAAVSSLGWKERLAELDLFGTLVFMPAIVCLLLALQWGGVEYDWNNARIIALFVLFGVLLIIFFAIQYWKQDHATVPPRIIKQRSMWAVSWFAFCLGSMFFLILYYLPIWFQAVKGASAVKSGIMNIPMVLSLVLISIMAGAFVSIVGYYAPLMVISSVIMSVGCGLLYTFEPNTGHPKWIGYQVLTGIGIGLGMQQPLIAVQTVLDLEDVPVGTSVLIFIQTIGGALFVSVGNNVFNNKLIKYVMEYVPDFDPRIVLSTGATSIQDTIDESLLPGVTRAYNDALKQTFLVATVMATLSIFGALATEWRSVKGKKIEMAAA